MFAGFEDEILDLCDNVSNADLHVAAIELVKKIYNAGADSQLV